MKKYLFGLFALALAVAFSAFTTAQKAKSIIVVEFIGEDNSETEIGNPENWREVDPECSSTTVATVCSVQFDGTFEEFELLVPGKDLDELLLEADVDQPKYRIQ